MLEVLSPKGRAPRGVMVMLNLFQHLKKEEPEIF
jgi:hypothetical protein